MTPPAGGGTTTSPGDLPVVVIAASAGGLAALSTVLGGLAVDLPAAVVVVQHLDPTHTSQLPAILARRTALEVADAVEGAILRPGEVRVAVPGRHLLVGPGRVLGFSGGPRVHFVRPSADRLLESVADNAGAGSVAVILTGTGSDGSGGVQAIKRRGGTVIAQDEATAEYFGMPQAALATGAVDLVLPLGEIADAVTRLVTPVPS